jgi:hypothetical protein
MLLILFSLSSDVLHGDDKVYILKDESFKIPLTGEENDHMEKVLSFWTNFAKTGNPNNFTEGSVVANINWTTHAIGERTMFEVGGSWSKQPHDTAADFILSFNPNPSSYFDYALP